MQAQEEIKQVGSQPGRTTGIFPLCIFSGCLIFLWARVITQLLPHWSNNPDYNYGYAVPFLCAFLLLHGWKTQSASVFAGLNSTRPFRASLLLLPLLGLAWIFVRFVGEANRDWRFIAEALALIAVVTTIVVLNSVFERGERFYIFPICFFLVAVPWPGVIEAPLVQTLSRAVAGMSVELLSFIGTPAVRHGNVIEVATGAVGVDDACSGIRSLQATLMVSLFFGQFYRLPVIRRLISVAAGLGLAVIFNVLRTTLLTFVASTKGLPAIAKWHDPAGVTILVGCFVCVWAISALLQSDEGCSDTSQDAHVPSGKDLSKFSPALRLTVPLLALLLAGEIGVQAWYGWHERALPQAREVVVSLPRQLQTTEVPWNEKTKRLLRFDEGINAIWEDQDRRWQVIYLKWYPRSVPGIYRGHTPKNCLTSVGFKMLSESETRLIPVGELLLPCRFFRFNTPMGELNVLYCMSANFPLESQGGSAYKQILSAALQGRRYFSQQSIELAVWGLREHEDPESVIAQQLKDLVSSGPQLDPVSRQAR